MPLDFELRQAVPEDWLQVVDLYKRSQVATGKPDPSVYPPEQLEEMLRNRRTVERWLAVLPWPDGSIVGHGIIEELSEADMKLWEPILEPDVLSRTYEL